MATAFLTPNVFAASNVSAIPEPLSLEYALSVVDDGHPSVALGQAEIASAKAERAAIDADNGFYASARLNARYIDDSNLHEDKQHNDSRAIVVLRKELYDFGRNERDLAAAEADVRGKEWYFRERLLRHRLEVTKSFFEVILADLRSAQANEAMAHAFVTADRARDRNELGQVSDIDTLELEDVYQTERLRRRHAEFEQRATRARLAQLLNRPESLPDTLVMPQLPANDSPLPEYERLTEAALSQNLVLHALRAELEASRLRVEALRRGGYPVLSSEVNAGYWARDRGNNREPFGASLILDIPLFSDGRLNAEVAREQADRYRFQAKVQQYEYNLREQVLEAWQEIQSLLLRREAAQVKLDYRDLYLDRSRARYELEIDADLGDSMARQTAAHVYAAETEFALALAWSRLAALVGEPDFNPERPPAENPLLKLTKTDDR